MDGVAPDGYRQCARGHEPGRSGRLASMERQALWDAMAYYNAEGLDGLRDRSKPGRISVLSGAEQALLLDAVFRGPDRAEDRGSDWTLPMLCRWIARRFGKRLHPASVSRVLRRLDLSRQKRGRRTRRPARWPRRSSPKWGCAMR